MEKLIIFILFFFFIAQGASASVKFYHIEVSNFIEKCNDEFVLIFKPIDNMASLSKAYLITLHIRFNVNCVTLLKQSDDQFGEKKKYLQAINKLKDQISKSKTIVFGLKSGKGFYKIPGKTTECQCDNLSVLKMGNKEIVYAVHADIGSRYCD